MQSIDSPHWTDLEELRLNPDRNNSGRSIHFLKRVWQRAYRLYSVRNNVTLGANVHIGIGTILDSRKPLTVADDVYIGKYCTIECGGSIGRWVMIANHVGLIGRYDHDFTCIGKGVRNAPWVGEKDYDGPEKNLQIIVEDDVWIGFGAVILSGVRIRRGAIVAAGSVVTKDVEPYAIVAGNPAHKRSVRFTPEQIRKHEAILYGAGTGLAIAKE